MSPVIVSIALLLAADQPPAVAPTQTADATQAAKPEPKMVCKYEFATGSRVQKVKVCRPENEPAGDQDTKLQRAIDRLGDMRIPGEKGGGVSAGSGIGN
ncbi:MAG: hypothetical protein QM773_19160 [Hyphomonadaceae bacterium]